MGEEKKKDDQKKIAPVSNPSIFNSVGASLAEINKRRLGVNEEYTQEEIDAVGKALSVRRDEIANLYAKEKRTGVPEEELSTLRNEVQQLYDEERRISAN